MIDRLIIKEFGPIEELDVQKLGPINIFIGANGSGKSFVLKAIYSGIKSIEQYKRGKEIKTIGELLSDKLYWTFQPNNLGDLVRKKSEDPLKFRIYDNNHNEFYFSFGKNTTKSIKTIDNTFPSTEVNSIFLPTKEILSSRTIITNLKDRDKEFGFDDTYYDLAKSLTPVTKGKNYKQFSKSREKLNNSINGRIFYDNERKEWKFRDNEKYEYPIGITSEGVKKISIIDTLLGNRYLSKGSTIFIDEPESNLHPKLLFEFLDIIYELSQMGIQFFIATHSYFVVKKLYIIAQKNKKSIPIISFEKDKINISNLKQGLPDNPIINESINLYKEEIDI